MQEQTPDEQRSDVDGRAEAPRKKTTIRQLFEKKARGERITSLGVYDSPMAAIADRVGFDLLIIGNAGPMSLLGHHDPTTVSFEEQLILTRAVSRVASYGLVVAHLPYMSYHASKEQAITSAARMVSEGGADCVKCEGNRYTAEYVAEIVRAGIPVMGHMGMQASRRTEQSGFGVKGRSAEEALEIVDSTRAFAEAGVFAFIVEHVPVEVTRHLSETLSTPIISLGAAPDADGIYHISGDVVGYSAFPIPPNRGSFADVRPIIEQALGDYRREVEAGTYPPAEGAYHMPDAERERFVQMASTEPSARSSLGDARKAV
jgi:3-methyl-2-oxobutanoate hydroxymethyltransferase